VTFEGERFLLNTFRLACGRVYRFRVTFCGKTGVSAMAQTTTFQSEVGRAYSASISQVRKDFTYACDDGAADWYSWTHEGEYGDD
jgi:hypothetical protein